MGHRIAVLQRRTLNKLGTPMQLTSGPSNLFVAQFHRQPADEPAAGAAVGGGTRCSWAPGAVLVEGQGPGPDSHYNPGGPTKGPITVGLQARKIFKIAPAANRNIPSRGLPR